MIPLFHHHITGKLYLNFLEKKYFTLYVSAGGMVEKCVYGKLADDKVNVKPLQFSVAGVVGAQFNATDHVGLYVEPGVSYFFDDGSKVQTIRKVLYAINFSLLSISQFFRLDYLWSLIFFITTKTIMRTQMPPLDKQSTLSSALRTPTALLMFQ